MPMSINTAPSSSGLAQHCPPDQFACQDLRFRAIFEQMQVGICEANLQGAITEVNPGFCHMLGYSRAELLQKSFQQITHPDDLDLDLEQYQQLLRGDKSSLSIEKRYIHKSGAPIWVNLTVCLIRDTSGQPQFSIGLSEDISDRKRGEAERKTTELALRQSEERYALAIQGSKVGVWDWTLATDQLYLSPNLVHLLGSEQLPEQMVTWQQHIHPDDQARVRATLKSHLTEATSQWEQSFRMVHPDGNLCWVLARGRGLRDDAGQVLRMAGTITDITAIKTAETALQESHQRIHNILESITDAFFALNLHWDFTYVNQRAEQLLNRQRRDILGQNFWYEFPETLGTEFSKQFRRAMSQRVGLTFEGYFDSFNRWFEVHVYSTQDGLAVYFQDITERIQVYEQIQHQIHREQALNRVVQTIRQSLDLDTIFATAAEEVCHLLQTDLVHIQTYCPQLGQWQVVAAHASNANIDGLLDQVFSDHSYPVAARLKRFEVVQTDHLPGWGDPAGSGPFPDAASGRWLLVPLHTNYQLPWGCLGLQRHQSLGHWKPSEVELVQIIADQLTIAIQHGQTLQQARQELRERQRAEARLKEAQRIARTGSWELDVTSDQVTWSEEMFRIFFELPSTGQPPSLVEQLTYLNAADQPLWQQTLHQAQLTGQPFELEGQLSQPPQPDRYVQMLGQGELDSQGQVVRLFGTLTDITERKQIEAQLVYEALHDSLTQTPNRAYFMDQLHAAVEQSKADLDAVFGVLFIDLDRFKVINDSLGHLVGDQLLVECARRLQSVVREDDLVARLGGDEFAILLNRIDDTSEALMVADRIHQILQMPLILEGREIFISASVGIASNLTGAIEAVDFLRDADTAMYRAKGNGRGCSALFDPAMYEEVNTQLTLENDLQRALERRELELHYQPIVELNQGNLIGFEALVRWRHPRWGLISPGTFIPLAEETGLILAIGEWTQTEACQQLWQWQQQFPQAANLMMSVNLSVKQFARPNLIAFIDNILAQTRLEPRHLRLEITESALIDNPDHAETILASLRQRGIQLCIDDFGTGYSSLSMVHQFPVHILKIDRSFISLMDTDDRGVAMVQAVLALANSLGMTAIAEGVETRQQLTQLQRLACPFAQGYWFSQPLPAAEVEALLTDQPWMEAMAGGD